MMQINTCEQGTTEWYQARIGLPTSSMFGTVMAKGKGGGDSLTRRKYLFQLAGEIVTGEASEGYTNGHTDRGHEMEIEARNYYEFMTDENVELVGFITNGQKGCSPDGLVGTKGMFEAKSKLPHLMIELLLRDEFPPEHKAQCQGALWVAEREWIDIVVYWPKLPLFIKRAYRDESYISTIATAVKDFNEELAEVVEQIRAYGKPKPVMSDREALQHAMAGG
jgi:hypothetical protein